MTDDDLGFLYCLNRWLDPQTGKWTSEDPIRDRSDEPNYYEYVGNQPTIGSDPTGLVSLIYYVSEHILFAEKEGNCSASGKWDALKGLDSMTIGPAEIFKPNETNTLGNLV
jgi:RHS repeat-associated protein